MTLLPITHLATMLLAAHLARPTIRPPTDGSFTISTGERVARLFMDGKPHTTGDIYQAFPDITPNSVSLFMSRYCRKGFVLDDRKHFLVRIGRGRYVINWSDLHDLEGLRKQ